MTPSASPTLTAGSATDVGLRRRLNEDSVLVAHPVYVVADGMGGHEAGEIASAAVIDAFRPLAGASRLDTVAVAAAIEEAHAAVRVVAESTQKGAGSTLVMAGIVEVGGRPHWIIAHIGDSRAYRLRDGALEQLTVDHSLVQELLDSGRLAPEEVEAFGSKNVITRAVGADDSAADFALQPIVTGDRLILCSDGLHGEVDDDRIAALAADAPSAQDAADALLAAALAAGGRDNVTVVVVDAVAGGVDAWLDDETAVGAAHVVPAPDTDLDEDTLQTVRRRR
jgi:PPM family protein phosphatase